MMNFYLLLPKEEQKFDRPKMEAAIRSIHGVYNARSGDFIGACFEWEFDYASDSVIGRIAQNLEDITLSERGLAGLKLAFEIKQAYGKPFRMTDVDYLFDVDLSDFATFEDLRAALYDNA